MTTLTHFATLASASLVSAIWQSALLVTCVALFLGLVPGITAAARSAVWTVVFVLTLGLPLAGFMSVGSSPVSMRAPLHADPRCALALIAAWVALSTVRAVRLLQSAARLYLMRRRSAPMAVGAEVTALLSRAKASLCISSEVDVPSVAGFFRPRILLPERLAGAISPVELHQIVLHELEHLRRRDDWTNLLQKLALVLFPLHPVLVWVEGRLCLERELACDDEVLRATEGRGTAYATCLTNLAEASLLRRGVSLALGAWQRQPELSRRVHRILRNPVRTMRPLHMAALAGLTAAAAVGIGLIAVRSPQLITFNGAPAVETSAISSPSLPEFRATFVKAAMPPSRPTGVSLSVPRRRHHRNRTLAMSDRRLASGPNVVLIGWQPGRARALRWAAPAGFQLTYAAVPTGAGWLFFQL